MAQPAEQMAPSSSGTSDQLDSLSKKAGVLATIVLDRSSGAIVTTTGSLASSAGLNSSSVLSASAISSEDSGQNFKEPQGTQEMASMVWNFVSAAGDMIQGLDTEDEMRLLRLRTKKFELVIVPDPKYLLIVVHETPAA
ncbi:MAG: hypothetical protein M1818_007336 [Claussenomyces sp. TS43310]|nr:MAG: hypothetical protein M1818_007336 [Claussenomyces sp. TS43310]